MEEFRKIPGYEHRYKVTDLGKVYDFKRNRYVTQSMRKNGTYLVSLEKKKFYTPQLVAMAFLHHKPENGRVKFKTKSKSPELKNICVHYYKKLFELRFDKYYNVEYLFRNKKWNVAIKQSNNKLYYLGSFDNKVEAAYELEKNGAYPLQMNYYD